MPSMPLIINQPERIKSRAETMLMRINRWVHGGNTFKESSIKICKKINRPLPEQEILRANAKFSHKLILNPDIQSLQRYVARPKRSTSRLFHVKPKKKLYRTPLEHHIQLYNQLPEDLKYLKPKTLAYKLKKREVEYTPED